MHLQHPLELPHAARGRLQLIATGVPEHGRRRPSKFLPELGVVLQHFHGPLVLGASFLVLGPQLGTGGASRFCEFELETSQAPTQEPRRNCPVSCRSVDEEPARVRLSSWYGPWNFLPLPLRKSAKIFAPPLNFVWWRTPQYIIGKLCRDCSVGLFGVLFSQGVELRSSELAEGTPMRLPTWRQSPANLLILYVATSIRHLRCDLDTLGVIVDALVFHARPLHFRIGFHELNREDQIQRTTLLEGVA